MAAGRALSHIPVITKRFTGIRIMRNALFIAAIAVAASAAPAFAQSTASVETTGTTQIIRPIAIQQTSALAFGTIVRPVSGSSTISIGSGADTASRTGTAVLLRGATSRAKYVVRGEGAEVVSVNVPATFNMTKIGGTDTLAVALTRNPAGNLTLGSTLGNEGTANLDIGGSFDVASTTATGNYSGTFTVSVNYN
jgi:hypothetical protein